MLTIYHNPRCRKSRETLQLIEDSGELVEVIEYLKEVPSKKDLTKIIEYLGIKPVELIRKGEADYKVHFKGKDLTDEEWIDAMLEYPKLIERPIVVREYEAVIGRPPENVKRFL
jgi:arsenate reductase